MWCFIVHSRVSSYVVFEQIDVERSRQQCCNARRTTVGACSAARADDNDDDDDDDGDDDDDDDGDAPKRQWNDDCRWFGEIGRLVGWLFLFLFLFL